MHALTKALGLALLALPSIAAAAPVSAPASLDVAGREPKLLVHAVGAQVYECKADAAGKLAWTFREPIAALISDGKTIGRHYAGPTWELNDSSLVKGAVVVTAPGATPKDIPWLKLKVADHKGAGALDGVTVVLRLNTQGGNLTGPCTAAGELRAEPYTADYAFLP